ncbi:MAG: 2-oxoglutarate dehydrogenase E1 component, partial [Gammaproteobacteria bacterium]|nr:2-oxoglutarate dehydrogenase E1 component [Gammaproteobacteria bacterium]
GAQVVFDQFISSGERKWLRMSGLVCLLPHGYEGQGPEHSSARLERYLQMCAEDNMQVANCTTPANYFHILRRQLKRDIRKPLIIMTPKSLLRHKRATSPLSMMDAGTSFHRLLWDDAEMQPDEALKLVSDDKIRRVILCSGKVYYDLLEKRRAEELETVALVRVEQLYPFPYDDVNAEIDAYPNAKSVVWCQEEPRNQGAWRSNRHRIERVLRTDQTLEYCGRDTSASPAAGYASLHTQQQATLVQEALGLISNGSGKY